MGTRSRACPSRVKTLPVTEGEGLKLHDNPTRPRLHELSGTIELPKGMGQTICQTYLPVCMLERKQLCTVL